MQTERLQISFTMEVSAPAGVLWKLLLDWGGVGDWTPDEFISSCTVTGEGIGATRFLTTPDGRVIGETLERVDPANSRVGFSITSGAPGGITRYDATVTLESLDEDRTAVTWAADMDIPAGADRDRFRSGFESSYRVVIESMARRAASGGGEPVLD